jgi:hypothetical protein
VHVVIQAADDHGLQGAPWCASPPWRMKRHYICARENFQEYFLATIHLSGLLLTTTKTYVRWSFATRSVRLNIRNSCDCFRRTVSNYNTFFLCSYGSQDIYLTGAFSLHEEL